MAAVQVRALRPSDASTARAIVHGQFRHTPHEQRLAEILDDALREEQRDAQGMIGNGVLLLYGAVAGASGVVKIHFLVSPDATTTCSLVGSLDARLLVAEIPADPPYSAMSSSLRDAGFVEEGCIADYVGDGVGLTLLVRRTP